MSISSTAQIFDLIKSLSKAEKRHFKLFSRRSSSKSDHRFIQLFDFLDKMVELDEEKLLRQLSPLKPAQFANLKRHLYDQILRSLRLILSNKQSDLQIRQQIDFAIILYGKGLYRQSLRLLEKTKEVAEKANEIFLLQEILEFEKMIELKHITRSRKIKNKVEQLIQDSSRIRSVGENISHIINFTLNISGLYIKIGHAKDISSRTLVHQYFKSGIKSFQGRALSFIEQVYIHQCYFWYYYILMDIPLAYRHSKKWVSLFESNQAMKNSNPDLYMRGIHYLLTACFYLQLYDQYQQCYDQLESFYKSQRKSFNRTSKLIYLYYGWNARINNHFLKGEYKAFIRMIPALLDEIEEYKSLMDPHRRIIFYYKIAWAYFVCNKYEDSLDYLNQIINLKQDQLRPDIFCYARLLHLLCHYELKNWDWVDNMIHSVNQSFVKNNERNDAQAILMDYLKTCIHQGPKASQPKLFKLNEAVQSMLENPLEMKPFMLFNFDLYVKSKIEAKSIESLRKDLFQLKS